MMRRGGAVRPANKQGMMTCGAAYALLLVVWDELTLDCPVIFELSPLLHKLSQDRPSCGRLHTDNTC